MKNVIAASVAIPWEIAEPHSAASVYDCLYVALAEREQCDLVTADQRLINNLQSKFPLLSRSTPKVL